jgi:Ca2+-binding RTX toxin-like protein
MGIYTGTAGNDTLTGGSGSDTIEGLAGDDILSGEGGSDLIYGGEGNDTVYADSSDTAYGGAGTDVVLARHDVISIKIGADSGFETISGNGYDGVTIQVIGSSSTIDLSSVTLVDIAMIKGTWTSETIIGSASADIIWGYQGEDTLRGGDGNDTFIADTMETYGDVFDGGDGYDQIIAANDDVVIMISDLDSIEEISSDGHSGVSILLRDGDGNTDFTDVLLTGIDYIKGATASEAITGSADDDVIWGYKGKDTLHGRAGNDIFLVDTDETFGDVFDGGDGYDQVFAANDDVTIMISDLNSIEEISSNGHSGVSIKLRDGGVGADFTDVLLTGIDYIKGDWVSEAITGSAGDDVIWGYQGIDTLNGGAGNDTFLVDTDETFGDVFDGGDGYDQIIAANDDVTIRINSIDSIEEISGDGHSGVSIQLDAALSTDFTGVVLTGIIAIKGTTSSDTITGSAGNDSITGAYSTDWL